MNLTELRQKLSLDPPLAQLKRALHVTREMGLVHEFNLQGVPDTLKTAVQLGIKTRAIHAFHAANHPERLALVDDRRQVSFGQANLEMNQLANALHEKLGVAPRSPVILMMENTAEYVVAWFALARLGARAVHASYRLTAPELEYLVAHSGARVVVASQECMAVASLVVAAHPGVKLVAVSDGDVPAGVTRYQDLLSQGASHVPGHLSSDVQSENIVYTSGTTGKPKGAVRDFASFGPTELFRVLERLPFHAGDRHLVVSPLYHSGAQVLVLLQSALGATLYLRPHFSPEDTLKAMHRFGIESTFMVPTMLRRLLELPDATFKALPTPSLRCIISGAAEFPHALRVQAIARFGASTIHDFYGATELGWVTIINGEEMLKKPGSVGRALAAQDISIQDGDGKEVPPGTVGTVYVRNAQTMAGYLHDDAATKSGQRGAWMTVDDLGHLDAEGYLFLSGRSRDMVKSGGVNIYPVEIEEVLAKHPSVRDVAVIGVPDEEWGERVTAVVVPKAGYSQQVLEQYAREHLSGPKIPRRWETVTELPRNNTGKVLKKDLRARFTPGSQP